MSKKKIILIAAVVIAVTGIIIGIMTIQQKKSTVSIPAEVATLVTKYMDAYKNGTEYSVEYIHFEDEFKRSAYVTARDKLVDYKIESAERINDNLYALTVLIMTEQSVLYNGETYQRVYNFAAKIDGEWLYLNGVSNIPLNIQDNLDPSKYTYNDENIVAPEDVMDVIELN